MFRKSLNKLAMSKIGINDELDWSQIRAMIRYLFRGTNIEIMVCSEIEYTEEEK